MPRRRGCATLPQVKAGRFRHDDISGERSSEVNAYVPTHSRAGGLKITREFYAQPVLAVARECIGKILVHRTPEGEAAGRIVEAEAYRGPLDLAAHSSRGLTKRTAAMFGPPGYAYIYRSPEGEAAGRIVEAEAYRGPLDLAAHSSRGLTKRTAAMFGPPGYAYIY